MHIGMCRYIIDLKMTHGNNQKRKKRVTFEPGREPVDGASNVGLQEENQSDL